MHGDEVSAIQYEVAGKAADPGQGLGACRRIGLRPPGGECAGIGGGVLAQEFEQLAVLVAGDGEGQPGLGHRLHQSQGLGAGRAAVGDVAQKDGQAALRVDGELVAGVTAVAERDKEAQQFVVAAVEAADQVEGPAQGGTVARQWLPDDFQRVQFGGTAHAEVLLHAFLVEEVQVLLQKVLLACPLRPVEFGCPGLQLLQRELDAQHQELHVVGAAGAADEVAAGLFEWGLEQDGGGAGLHAQFKGLGREGVGLWAGRQGGATQQGLAVRRVEELRGGEVAARPLRGGKGRGGQHDQRRGLREGEDHGCGRRVRRSMWAWMSGARLGRASTAQE